jgi:hypothetical protein
LLECFWLHAVTYKREGAKSQQVVYP